MSPAAAALFEVDLAVARHNAYEEPGAFATEYKCFENAVYILAQRIGDMLGGKIVFIILILVGRKRNMRRFEQAHDIGLCMF